MLLSPGVVKKIFNLLLIINLQPPCFLCDQNLNKYGFLHFSPLITVFNSEKYLNENAFVTGRAEQPRILYAG